MSFQYTEQFWRVCQQTSTLPLVRKLITRWEFSNIQVCRVPKGTTVSSHTFASTDLNLMVLQGFMARTRFLFAKQRSYFGFLFNYSMHYGSVRAHVVFGGGLALFQKGVSYVLYVHSYRGFNQEEKWLSPSHTWMHALNFVCFEESPYGGWGFAPFSVAGCHLKHCLFVSWSSTDVLQPALRRLFVFVCVPMCPCMHMHTFNVATIVLTWMWLLTTWLHRGRDFK